jgi:uncharacterized protein
MKSKILSFFSIMILFFVILSGGLEGQLMVKKNAMDPLPLGSIQPKGWLKNQLRIQADGLSGHLDEFWPDIKNSAWFGSDGDTWERAPYWLDGVVPLAYLLEDEALKARVVKYVDTIIRNQDEDGWIGPKEDSSQYDLWAIFLVLKPLIQYYEATGDERVPRVVEKTLGWVESHIDRRPLFNWGKFRWFEALLSIYWLYERDPQDWLVDLAIKLQAQGFDYMDFYRRFPLTEITPKGKWTYMGHVVNNAMAVKAPALWWKITGEKSSRDMAEEMIGKLDLFHGSVTGMFTGDECFAGKNPSQGTELCAVVEYMFSMELLSSVLGDAAFGDRLEKITFNALPATFSPDMWSHQYDQQVNQVECSILEGRNWTTNGPESNIFGLEPNFGCCTANLSQGWPKFASHLWMKTQDEGLAAVAYAPCEVSARIKGANVRILVETDYPFREEIKLKISADSPVGFPLYLRIPEWADKASFTFAGNDKIDPLPGEYFKIQADIEGDALGVLQFPMEPRASRRYNNAIAVERGPLVYSLKIGERWERVNEDKPYRELPHGDWEVYPTTPWNYALDVSEDTLDEDLKFKEQLIGDLPFSPEGAPVSAAVKGILLDEWMMENGSAGEMPVSPVARKEGKLHTLTLIPYGCTNLRITEFPTLNR